ncbi:MAG: hypothetical protein QNL91_04520, partial [Candidatus Krumholzibacteria bacterium]|nr:hypothetical protein [Candidatus Krumholzibacteria bacterium]
GGWGLVEAGAPNPLFNQGRLPIGVGKSRGAVPIRIEERTEFQVINYLTKWSRKFFFLAPQVTCC